MDNEIALNEQEVTHSEPATDKKVFTPFIIASGALGVCAIAVFTASRLSVGFAEAYARTVSQWLRALLGTVTGWIPFSLGECVLLSLVPIAILTVAASSNAIKRSDSPAVFRRWTLSLVAVIVDIVALYVLTLGVANYRQTLDVNLGITRADVTAQELTATAERINEEISNVIGEIGFNADGASVMPYDFYELCGKMNDAYEKYCEKNDYISTFRAFAKPVALSEPMTYTHISGVYTFYTGESNVNINYPDFVIPYTMAHEMAHARGIARETEANFVAFLVCMESDDAYIRYSALIGMQEYILSAVNSADSELYAPTFYSLDSRVIGELRAYSAYFDKYRDSTASKVADKVNDTFLQVQGQTAGTRSYGLVVDLTVAYYKEQANNQ